jgi:hypothetical protein
MIYPFLGFFKLPEHLKRKTWDDVFCCIYCGHKTMDWRIEPVSSLLLSTPTQRKCFCSECGKHLAYFDHRDYGLTRRQIEKENAEKHEPWENVNTPLWACMFGKGGRQK